MKYMHNRPEDLTAATSSGFATATTAKKKATKHGPQVAGQYKQIIVSRLRRAQSASDLETSEYNPSQLAIFRSLKRGTGSDLQVDTSQPIVESGRGSDSEADSDVLSPHILRAQLSARQPSDQSDDDKEVSVSASFLASQPMQIPARYLGIPTTVPVHSLSPVLSSSVPVSLSASAAAHKKSSIEISLEEMAARLKEKILDESHLSNDIIDDGSIGRAVSHIVIEMTEVIAFTPKIKGSIGVSQASEEECKESKPNIIIHYKHPFYDSMNTALKLAGESGYDAGRIFHKHEPVYSVSKDKKIKHPKALNGLRPKLPEGKTIFDGASVIVPICIGYEGALTEAKLEEVLKFYSDHNVKDITVYIGEYNKLEDPVDQLERIGKEKYETWAKLNEKLLEKYNVKTLLREDLVKADEYKNAEIFVQEKLTNKQLKFGSVIKDAQNYIEGRTKPSTPPLVSQNDAGREPVSSLMLSDEIDDEREDLKAVAQAVIQDSKNKAQDAAAFLIAYRKQKEADRRQKEAEGSSVYQRNTMFSASAATSKHKSKKSHETAAQLQVKSKDKGSRRMSPGGVSSGEE
jgi:hypothetical protein